jgi:hypothetical protein
MEASCVAPGCHRKAVAVIRQEAPVCLDHYWTARIHLERLQTTLGEFDGRIQDLFDAAPTVVREAVRLAPASQN